MNSLELIFTRSQKRDESHFQLNYEMCSYISEEMKPKSGHPYINQAFRLIQNTMQVKDFFNRLINIIATFPQSLALIHEKC